MLKFWFIPAGIVVVILAVLLRFVFFPLFVAEKVIESAEGVVEKTLDSDNVLYNYEWFKQTCQDVQAIDVKIQNTQSTVNQFREDAGPRADWGFTDKDEFGRLNAVVLGLKNQRQDMVAKYNARSKMANRSIFKSGELPETLE